MSSEKFEKLMLEQMAELRKDLSGMKADISDMKAEMSGMKEMIAQNQQMTADLIRIVGNTNAIVEELRKDVIEMKEIQTQQGKVLETLAYHSMEHEADIKALRRIR